MIKVLSEKLCLVTSLLETDLRPGHVYRFDALLAVAIRPIQPTKFFSVLLVPANSLCTAMAEPWLVKKSSAVTSPSPDLHTQHSLCISKRLQFKVHLYEHADLIRVMPELLT